MRCMLTLQQALCCHLPRLFPLTSSRKRTYPSWANLSFLQTIGLQRVVRHMLRSLLQTLGGVLHIEVLPLAPRLISRLLTPLVLLLHPKGHRQTTWLSPFLLSRVVLVPLLSPTKMGDAVRLVLSFRLLTPHVWLSHP